MGHVTGPEKRQPERLPKVQEITIPTYLGNGNTILSNMTDTRNILPGERAKSLIPHITAPDAARHSLAIKVSHHVPRDGLNNLH